jgi:hypothetical protein
MAVIRSANTGPIAEIQPSQYVIGRPERRYRPSASSAGVDAQGPGLYKGANGGGRNPAAAVL